MQQVQAICDWVNNHLTFGYGASTATTTALDAYERGTGVCRDFAHLAITFCRALNIPARYVCGYIPDIAVTPPDLPMDFCAWLEAYLEGRWWTFDPRINVPRTGRGVTGGGGNGTKAPWVPPSAERPRGTCRWGPHRLPLTNTGPPAAPGRDGPG